MTVEACGPASKILVTSGSGSICVGQAVNLSGGALVDGDNVGAGEGEVYRDKTGSTLNFRTFTGVGGITVDINGDVVRVDGSGISGRGEVNLGASLGGGDAAVFIDKTDVTLNFRSISGTGGIVVSENGNVVEVDGSAFVTGPAGVDGQLQFNDGGSFGGADLYWDGTLLGFGGLAATNSGLKRVGTTLTARLGDDSGDASISADDVVAYGDITVSASGELIWDAQSKIASPLDGILTLTNFDGDDFELLRLGGDTSGYPAWRRSGAGIDAVLADQSDWAGVSTGTLDAWDLVDVHDNDVNNVNSIRFNLTPVNGAEEGRMIWDSTEKTVSIGMAGGTVNLQVGQEHLIRVRNTDSVTILNGQVVRQSGNTAGFPNVVRADKGSLLTTSIAGMATEDIAVGGYGYVTSAGKVNGIDTSLWPTMTPLWVDTAGAVTATRPTAPTIASYVGQVIRQSATEGNVYLRPTIVQRISWSSDCNILDTTLTDGDLIGWDLANLRWDRLTQTDLGVSLAPSIDHGSLEATSLLDDDHTQYLLVDGSRAMTGQLQGIGGSTGVPAFSCGASNSGMSQAFANNLNFSVGGSLKWSIDSSNRWWSSGGVVASAGGTAALPGYSFATGPDYDTGMYRAGANELGFATGGVERGRFGSSGGLTIAGGADIEQLVVKANATQSNSSPLIELQDSIGTSLCALHSDDVTNLFLGIGAGASNTTGVGINNVFVGNLAGNSNQTGKGVVAIGRTASYLATDADNVVAIGLNACQNNQSDRIVGIGTNSVFSNTSGLYNFAMGMNSLRYNQVGGSNICLGDGAGQGSSGNSFSNAVFMGRNAGFSNQTGSGMVCIGRDSGYFNTTGSNCFFAGYEAGYSNVSASTNFGLGGASLKYNQVGINNTAIGFEAGRGVSGHSISGNLLLGSAAGQNLETGGDDNSCLGVSSGQLLSSGAGNFLGGARTGDNLTSGSRNIIIGTGLDASSATVSDELNIGAAILGDLSTGDIQLVANLEIDGDLNHDGTGVGFYGTAPVAQSAAYTPTNVSADRSYDANATTIHELADVLGTLIADLQATGLIG
jgi:hypothetical protein